jgi:hypothetical protein
MPAGPGAAVVMALGLLLTGCVTTQVGDHQPTIDTLSALRNASIARLNVGDFSLAKGLDPALDRGISSRGNPMKPPGNSTFSQYLRDSLITDLKAADKYDSASPYTVRGELTESQLHTPTSEASAALAARIYVQHAGQIVYDKVLRESKSWKSSFMGVIAIPEAFNQYTALYGALLEQLYADPAFREACSTH